MILRTQGAITGLRGKWFPFPVDDYYPYVVPNTDSMFEGDSKARTDNTVEIDSATREILRNTQVLPTFHPAALLRNPNLKTDSWADLKMLRDALKSCHSVSS
jgi:hypothetical protein